MWLEGRRFDLPCVPLQCANKFHDPAPVRKRYLIRFFYSGGSSVEMNPDMVLRTKHLVVGVASIYAGEKLGKYFRGPLLRMLCTSQVWGAWR